ncbi:MAG: response regulator, partial [Candidatus Latescibacteria bacterium]|nr:response regulator [Candidatus Latescibacterota bacterium]
QGAEGMLKGGTGLGLAITQSLLELMGTRLELDSAVGQGSRFFFALELPPAQGELRAAEAVVWEQVQRLAEGYTVKALVVDDVAENWEVLEQLLSGIGAQVELATSGAAAVERMGRGGIDIVFMDIRMPQVDGMEAARRIWGARGKSRVKMVAVSASTLRHEQQHYLELGFDGFIDKPVRAERVYACLAELLGVEYEYAEEAMAQAEVVDLARIALPEELLAGLREAAGAYNVTQVKEYLDQVEALGSEAARLAAHWRERAQEYDLEAILSNLKEIGRE